MGVLAQWAATMREVARRDEGVPRLAAVFGLTILVLGFTLHGFLVAQKSDLVPLFDHPLAEPERGRVARVLEDECATCVFSPGTVLVAREQKSRLLARLAQPEPAGVERDPLLALIAADAGTAGSDGAARTATASPPGPACAGAAVPVPEQTGTEPGAWTLYNITCDEDGAGGDLRRRPARERNSGGR